MMKCRGMGAAMRKLGGGMMKPVAMREGKSIERKKKNLDQQKKAAENFKNKVTEPVKNFGRNVGNRLVRAGTAGLSGMGATALGLAGAGSKIAGSGEADEYLRRSRNALRSAGRSAKAVVMGEPDDLESPSKGIVDIAGAHFFRDIYGNDMSFSSFVVARHNLEKSR